MQLKNIFYFIGHHHSGDVLSTANLRKEIKEENYYTRESCYGSFQRSVRLPAEVQSDKVAANFKDGVLDIKMPKSETSKSKKIEIKSS